MSYQTVLFLECFGRRGVGHIMTKAVSWWVSSPVVLRCLFAKNSNQQYAMQYLSPLHKTLLEYKVKSTMSATLAMPKYKHFCVVPSRVLLVLAYAMPAPLGFHPIFSSSKKIVSYFWTLWSLFFKLLKVQCCSSFQTALRHAETLVTLSLIPLPALDK